MAYQEIEDLYHVICGSQLTEQDIKCLEASLIIKPGEKVLRMWAFFGWRKSIDISDVLVGITDKALFKFEKHKLTRIPLSTILYATLKTANLIRWNKMEIFLKNETSETIGIFHKSSCAHFVDFINRMVGAGMAK
jgi:hypothetical protein